MYKHMNENKKAPDKSPIQLKNVDLPTTMKSRLEVASGLSFDDVRIHYNSEKPAALRAYAYTQGADVYIAPRQERHLSHELGHVIQQKRGAVEATGTLNGVPINNDPVLEKAADTMSLDHIDSASGYLPSQHGLQHSAAQCSPRCSAVQRKPWHSDVKFPRDKLVCDNLVPTTPITGYAFIGYTYPARNTLSAANQTGAITKAAEFIGGLPTPESSDLVGTKDITKELQQKDPFAKGNVDADQDANALTEVVAALTEVDAALATVAADTPPDTIVSKILEKLPKYRISELLPPEIPQRLALYSRLRTFCPDPGADKTDALDKIRADADYNNDKILPADLRVQIESSPSTAAIINILDNKLLKLFCIEEYNQRERETRRNHGLKSRKTGNRIDPFHIEVKTAYSDVTMTNTLNLHYQFSKESYGYVVKIQRNTETYRMQNNRTRDNVSPGYYASAHEHNSTDNISDTAAETTKAVNTGNPVTDAENRKHNNDIFDAITKLAGEGSRWKCVRALAANLRNDSIFYTFKDPTCYYITFQKLWASWKSDFDQKYNIEDSTVADKLQNSLTALKQTAAITDFNPDSDKDYCLDPH